MARKTEAELLGAVVRKRRLECGLSQERVAERAGLHATFISRIEGGARQPSFGSLRKIARSLEIPVAELAAEIDAALTRARY